MMHKNILLPKNDAPKTFFVNGDILQIVCLRFAL